MDPDKKSALDKIARRDRVRLFLVPGLILLGLVLFAAFFFMPREQLGAVEGKVQRFVQRASDNSVQAILLVELSDGQTIRIKSALGDGALAPGARVCLQRTRHPILRWYRYIRLPDARCRTE